MPSWMGARLWRARGRLWQTGTSILPHIKVQGQLGPPREPGVPLGTELVFLGPWGKCVTWGFLENRFSFVKKKKKHFYWVSIKRIPDKKISLCALSSGQRSSLSPRVKVLSLSPCKPSGEGFSCGCQLLHEDKDCGRFLGFQNKAPRTGARTEAIEFLYGAGGQSSSSRCVRRFPLSPVSLACAWISSLQSFYLWPSPNFLHL